MDYLREAWVWKDDIDDDGGGDVTCVDKDIDSGDDGGGDNEDSDNDDFWPSLKDAS